MSPDIQGEMTHALMYSGENLVNYFFKILNLKKDEDNKVIISEQSKEYKTVVKKFERDTTKLMEGYKYYGKDIDVNEWFKTFQTQVINEEYKGKLPLSYYFR